MSNIISDLGLNAPFIKGQAIPVRNCWHFTIDGRKVDVMFFDRRDFKEGINRIFVVKSAYRVVILAFVLMDNHFHFVLYGTFEECNRFVHEYARRTSLAISKRHGEKHKLDNVPIHHQVVDDDRYLKTVICYTIKNPAAAGLSCTPWDYPWSSGPLYFRASGEWSSARWLEDKMFDPGTLGNTDRKRMMNSHECPASCVMMSDGMIFPGCFVDFQLVEKLFRTPKGYLYFLGATKDTDVEERGGVISHLSIPSQEMRQNKADVCKEMFGVESTRSLSTSQRIMLAKRLRSKYNSSVKQDARLCGLI